MANLLRKGGETLILEGRKGWYDGHYRQLTTAFGHYLKSLPDRWALVGPELRYLRSNFGQMRVGDIGIFGGHELATCVGLGFGGYLIGMGNRTPFQHMASGFREFADKFTGFDPEDEQEPPIPYGTKVPQTKKGRNLEDLMFVDMWSEAEHRIEENEMFQNVSLAHRFAEIKRMDEAGETIEPTPPCPGLNM